MGAFELRLLKRSFKLTQMENSVFHIQTMLYSLFNDLVPQSVLIEHHFLYADIAYDRLSVNVSIDNMFKIIFLEKGPISPRAHFRDFEHRIFMFLIP